MMNRPTSIAYIDLLSILLVVFVVIAALLIVQNHKAIDANIISKAEFVAILEWNENSNADVDLWVRNPLNNVIYYRNQNEGLVSLDRDDTGIDNNSIIDQNGQKIDAPVRREMTSVRGIIPGKFVVNIMMYALRNNPPITAKVQIIKLNPYKVITEKEVVLKSTGQEVTIASFDVLPDGSVTDVDTTTQIMLSEVIK